MVAIIIAGVIVLLVISAVLSPWQWPQSGAGPEEGQDLLTHAASALFDLEAARDAKYREIRDAELDRETGKLSTDDFIGIDAGLRAEAVEILKRLDRARARLEKLQGQADHVPTEDVEQALADAEVPSGQP